MCTAPLFLGRFAARSSCHRPPPLRAFAANTVALDAISGTPLCATEPQAPPVLGPKGDVYICMSPILKNPVGAQARASRGMTLVEVIMALAILSVAFAGVIGMYLHAAYRAEWSGYSLAAQGLAIQQIEQAKSAVWDTSSTPVKNELTNIATVTSAVLDIPILGSNVVWATNYASIVPVQLWSNPVVSAYLVRVDTVWPFRWKNRIRYYTNTVVDYMAPD
jgi:prepilin-type N-terminal cleavage/methylation domain-containing protein